MEDMIKEQKAVFDQKSREYHADKGDTYTIANEETNKDE